MALSTEKGRCFLCPENRPKAKKGPGVKWDACNVCGRHLDAEERERKARLQLYKRDREPIRPDNDLIPRFVTWRGHTVGLYSQGNGKYSYQYYLRYSGDDLRRLPKRGALDLNVHCPGYDRGQIKGLKKLIIDCYTFACGGFGNGKLPDIRPT